jgi:hypothetical protein
MGAGAAQMRALERRLEKVPDEAVTELVRWFVPRSEVVGGRMLWFGRNVKLTSKIKARKKHQSASTVILGGVPVSCWSIKSYGRKGNYPVKSRRKEALSLKAFSPGVFFQNVTVKRSVNGDRRWDRLSSLTLSARG